MSTKRSYKLKQKYSFHLWNFIHDFINKIIRVDLFMSNFEKVVTFSFLLGRTFLVAYFKKINKLSLFFPNLDPPPELILFHSEHTERFAVKKIGPSQIQNLKCSELTFFRSDCWWSYNKSLRIEAYSFSILIKKYLNYGVFQRTSTLNLSKV